MPRTCRACSSQDRTAIDKAIAIGEPLRNIAKRVSISPAALLRHKVHAGQALVKAAEKREESIGESVMSRLEKLYQRAERVLNEAEASGDGRLALAGIREVRETLGGLFTLATKTAGGGLSDFSDEELTAESKRRGLDMLIEVRSFHVGQAPVDEWEELPASAAACLPGRPAGTLYLCRKWVGDPHVND
jgi:hypothetical protein